MNLSQVAIFSAAIIAAPKACRWASAIPAVPRAVLSANAKQPLGFTDRFFQNGAWSALHAARSANPQVESLVKGETPPTAFTLYQSPKLA